MYFAYETDYLCGLSTFGRKIEWMRANPKVCVKVRALEYSV
jgi:nitroimidazol reductase NimA-like FMN-containing flavoprotein (pyridoxamine 5'-phosphate oxidase superfamily)